MQNPVSDYRFDQQIFLSNIIYSKNINTKSMYNLLIEYRTLKDGMSVLPKSSIST